MNKKTKYAIYGSAILAIANGVWNAIKQSNNIDKDPSIKFNWQSFLAALAKGAIAGGAGGYVIGAVEDYYNSKEKPIKTDILLFAAVNDVRLDRADKRFLKLNEKAAVLTQILKAEFKGKLSCEPFRLGSTEKGTALKNQFDIDICLSFKPRSFSSTEKMYETVEEVLENYVGTNSIKGFRRQKKSIGVFIEINGGQYKIDILPNKLSAVKGNKTSGYLYVNDNSLFGTPSYTKTNVKELNAVKLTETQKKIIVAFKDWKERNGVPLGSHLLQCLVLDAYKYNRGKIPKSFSKKLIMVSTYITDHIETITIRSIENTNNVVTNIPVSDKAEIRQACKRIVDDYAYQPNSIINHFCQ